MPVHDVDEWKGSELEKGSKELREHLLHSQKKPVVFKRGIAGVWKEALSWDPLVLCEKLQEVKTTFKVCPKRDTPAHSERFGRHQVVYETHCEYVQATFGQFAGWLQQQGPEYSENTEHACGPASPETVERPSKRLKGEDPPVNPLMTFPRSEYWVYADYKYMSQLLCDEEEGEGGRGGGRERSKELIRAIDWSVFGFPEYDGSDSTLWVGSEEAYTPCHYDTYGCNLVAQLSGRKKWRLFPPKDSPMLYPTRVPFEESSVYSAVNVSRPDLSLHPGFRDAEEYEATLCAGDVLFVPMHWWHHVECLEPSTSINTWIHLNSDSHERVKEAIVRAIVSAFISGLDDEEIPIFLNPNEELFSDRENFQLLSLALRQWQGQQSGRDGGGGGMKKELVQGSEEGGEEEEEGEGGEEDEGGEGEGGEEGEGRKMDGISLADFLRAVSSDQVLEAIASVLESKQR